MYRCSVCNSKVGPGKSRLLHQEHRRKQVGWDDGKPVMATEIASEHPVCPACYRSLEAGVPYSVLTRQHRPVEEPQPQVAKPATVTIGKPVCLSVPDQR